MARGRTDIFDEACGETKSIAELIRVLAEALERGEETVRISTYTDFMHKEEEGKFSSRTYALVELYRKEEVVWECAGFLGYKS